MNKTAIVETDLVLIHIEEKPAFYGRVEHISPDSKRGWWRVRFLFLTFPHQLTTWIVDDDQLRGADFTMGGTPIRIEKLEIAEDTPPAESATGDEEPQQKARVLSMAPKKDKKL